MTKLSDTQLVILAAASQRFDGNVLPLPGSLRGGARGKVIGALQKRGLIAERVGQDRHEPDASHNTVWRNEDDGRAVRLFITETGLAAINCEPEDALAEHPKAQANEASWENLPDHGTPSGAARKGKAARKPRGGKKGAPDAPKATGAAKTPARRAGTKQAQLIDMLRAPEGASIDEIVAATGWQPHTVRGAIAGALKKKLGLEVTSEKIHGRGRVYRLPAEA